MMSQRIIVFLTFVALHAMSCAAFRLQRRARIQIRRSEKKLLFIPIAVIRR